MPSAPCPECDERVYIKSDTEQGEIVTCEECDSKLELVGLDPPELDPYVTRKEDEYDDGFNIFDDDTGL